MKNTSSNMLSKSVTFAQKAFSALKRGIWWNRKLLLVQTPMVESGARERDNFADVRIVSFASEEGRRVMEKNFPKKAKLFRARLKQTDVWGWGIFRKDEPIGYLWAATASYYEPALRCPVPLAEQEAYFFDGIVYKQYRQGALPTYVNKLAWQQLMALGKTMSIAMVKEDNRRALLFHYLMGYKDRFQRIFSPCLLGIALRPRFESYTTPVLTRQALRSKK